MELESGARAMVPREAGGRSTGMGLSCQWEMAKDRETEGDHRVSTDTGGLLPLPEGEEVKSAEEWVQRELSPVRACLQKLGAPAPPGFG